MDSTGSHPIQPARDSLESDPAYDYAEDAPVECCPGNRGRGTSEEADRLVPLDADDFLGDETPVVPLKGKNSLNRRKTSDSPARFWVP